MYASEMPPASPMQLLTVMIHSFMAKTWKKREQSIFERELTYPEAGGEITLRQRRIERGMEARQIRQNI